MFDIKDVFAEFAKRGLFQTITKDPCDVYSCVNFFRIETIQDIGNLDDLQIQNYYQVFPKKIDEMKQLRNCCLYGHVIFPDPEQPYNDEGVPVYRSNEPGNTDKFYCGCFKGRAAMPGSDGHCGPKDGPQCWACEHFEPGVSAKQGAGACKKISELHRLLAEAKEGSKKRENDLEMALEKKNRIIQRKDVALEASNKHRDILQEMIKTNNQEILELTTKLETSKRKSQDQNKEIRELTTELETSKRRRKDTNAVLSDLLSGEVPGSFTDVEEALRKANELVLRMNAQVETMRAEKERREAAEKILKEKRKLAETNAPHYLKCSITLLLMVDPVVDRYGDTYEREAITKWLEKNNTSPNNRGPLTLGDLTLNKGLLDAIEAHVAAQVL